MEFYISAYGSTKMRIDSPVPALATAEGVQGASVEGESFTAGGQDEFSV